MDNPPPSKGMFAKGPKPFKRQTVVLLCISIVSILYRKSQFVLLTLKRMFHRHSNSGIRDSWTVVLGANRPSWSVPYQSLIEETACCIAEYDCVFQSGLCALQHALRVQWRLCQKAFQALCAYEMLPWAREPPKPLSRVRATALLTAHRARFENQYTMQRECLVPSANKDALSCCVRSMMRQHDLRLTLLSTGPNPAPFMTS